MRSITISLRIGVLVTCIIARAMPGVCIKKARVGPFSLSRLPIVPSASYVRLPCPRLSTFAATLSIVDDSETLCHRLH